MHCLSVFKNGKTKGPDTRFLAANPITGELSIYQTEALYREGRKDKSDTIRFSQILCVMPETHPEFTKRDMCCVEL